MAYRYTVVFSEIPQISLTQITWQGVYCPPCAILAKEHQIADLISVSESKGRDEIKIRNGSLQHRNSPTVFINFLKSTFHFLAVESTLRIRQRWFRILHPLHNITHKLLDFGMISGKRHKRCNLIKMISKEFEKIGRAISPIRLQQIH